MLLVNDYTLLEGYVIFYTCSVSLARVYQLIHARFRHSYQIVAIKMGQFVLLPVGGRLDPIQATISRISSQLIPAGRFYSC